MNATPRLRSFRPRLLAVCALLLVACGANDGTREDADTTPADLSAETPDTPDVAATGPVFRTSIGDWTMQPGDETTRCVHRRLDNDEPIWVTAIDTRLAPGSHHLIVYRSVVTEEDGAPSPCTPFLDVLDGEAYPLMISQVSEETLRFPAGVALRLEPHQMIRLEAHYLDYLPGPIVAHADVTFHTIPASEVVNEAGLMLYGTPDIEVAPGEDYATPWFYLPIREGANLFAATGHTHRYGTNVELRKAAASSPTGLPDEPVDSESDIYPGDAPFKWDESPVVTYDPPLHFAADEGMRYRCSWRNTSNAYVYFGESANQEMCFFWLYYYPSDGYRLCINLGSWYDYAEGLAQRVECCPDSAVCPLVRQFLENRFGGSD